MPVKALLARQGGGFAVELAGAAGGGSSPWSPGLYADGFVEVEGDLREGQTGGDGAMSAVLELAGVASPTPARSTCCTASR